LKFKTKITGEARSKLLVRDLTSTWRDVKQILEENYDVKRTLDYYACRMFSSRQGPNENVASWSSRIDTMQSQLREAEYRICADEELIGAIGLINHLAKACFVQLLSNERVQTIVRAKGETALLSVCIDAAMEEESAILSTNGRGFTAPPPPEIVQEMHLEDLVEGLGSQPWKEMEDLGTPDAGLVLVLMGVQSEGHT
jgi:hypothetical protein